MATIEMTEATFENTVQENEIVLIDFWAEWCGPCKMFGPVFEKVSEQHPDVVFAKVDTEQEQALAARFGIRSIPTLAVFREQVLLLLQPGAAPEAALSQVIEKAKELDMDEVRAEIAAQAENQQAT